MKIVIVSIFLILTITHILHALHVFQQNRYELDRYTKWLLDLKNLRPNGYFTYVALAFIAEYLFVHFLVAIDGLAIIIVTALTAIVLLYREEHKTYIKPLVYTDRVKRQIICISILDIILVSLLVFSDTDLLIIACLLPLTSWLLIYPMAIITRPLEEKIKKGYENEARDILAKSPELIKVAITGSYGKTSTKNVLYHILDEKYYTLMTPASYNTPMGVTRTIREEMKPIHELFLCEMGADHKGDITYLMDFVKPSIGILTSIGPQHLNTFGSLDNIIKEKFEVIERLPSDGLGIINIDNELIRDHKIENDVRIVTVGIDSEADYRAYDVHFDNKGSSFKVMIDDEEYEFETALLGKHNITNLLLGIALGHKLGIETSKIIDAIRELRPIAHRLETREINGYHFIDNAFNSNPVSSRLSLDVLAMMPQKRVIVTPGLIDLGKDEERYNEEFGAYMKDRADHVILVGKGRARAILKGLERSGFDMSEVDIVDDIYKAFDHIYQNFTKDDTILLENDLPDAFSN